MVPSRGVDVRHGPHSGFGKSGRAEKTQTTAIQRIRRFEMVDDGSLTEMQAAAAMHRFPEGQVAAGNRRLATHDSVQDSRACPSCPSPPCWCIFLAFRRKPAFCHHSSRQWRPARSNYGPGTSAYGHCSFSWSQTSNCILGSTKAWCGSNGYGRSHIESSQRRRDPY